jgi:hypothetical protein
LSAFVIIVPQQLLLLRIHRNNRPTPRQCLSHLPVNITKLRIPIRMIFPLFHLPVALQTIVHVVQQLGDFHIADRMSSVRQFSGQCPRTLARPTQRSFRIASGRGFHQPLQGTHQTGIFSCNSVTPCPRSTYPAGRQRLLTQFLHAFRNRHTRQPAGAADLRYSSVAQSRRLAGRCQSPSSFIQMSYKLPNSMREPGYRFHARKDRTSAAYCKCYFLPPP